ncbi:prolyl oligopeptidase family serine peptidase [Latilactobacillus graminis]|uniref:Hydrolase n=2 Tax=Latilactobacillus graminis TaxID=60519 RepID=A0AA89I253_9LACO|nr:prolyl oligopeptidase family serine peptidase [Latilactobacillus graminis]KRM24276.1 hydrolase [Latilactobacillus graminis DSM 20719]QFP78746.1 prolyl oligopeptidase family serine peptidase [Latilactobacillus graminis]
MISTEERKIGAVSTLIVTPSGQKDRLLPTVFVYHGWTHRKESELMLAHFLAKAGFRVILPDAKYHGKRHGSQLFSELMFEFWDIVMQSVTEFGELVAVLSNEGLVDPEQIGVTGTSMGGITTDAILTRYSNVKIGVDKIGAPMPVALAKWQVSQLPMAMQTKYQGVIEETLARLTAYDLSLNSDQLAGRPLHFYHGTADTMVPYQFTADFMKQIKDQPSPTTALVTLTTEKNGQHKVSDDAQFKTVALMQQYLQ